MSVIGPFLLDVSHAQKSLAISLMRANATLEVVAAEIADQLGLLGLDPDDDPETDVSRWRLGNGAKDRGSAPILAAAA
jgi:hypothetical protein